MYSSCLLYWYVRWHTEYILCTFTNLQYPPLNTKTHTPTHKTLILTNKQPLGRLHDPSYPPLIPSLTSIHPSIHQPTPSSPLPLQISPPHTKTTKDRQNTTHHTGIFPPLPFVQEPSLPSPCTHMAHTTQVAKTHTPTPLPSTPLHHDSPPETHPKKFAQSSSHRLAPRLSNYAACCFKTSQTAWRS